MTNIPPSPGEDKRKGTHSPVLTRNLKVLIISASLLGAAMTIHSSLMQPLVLQLGGSIAIVGVVSSISGLSMMLPMLLFGEYSDSVGRRRPILIASLFLVVAGLLFWTATYWIAIIPAVLFAGFAIALNGPASSAATSESVSAGRRGSAFAYRYSGRLLTGVIATFLGIMVLRRGTLQSAFLLFTIFALCNLGVVYFLLNETHLSPRPFSSARFLQNVRNNLRVPPKLRYMYFYIAILDPFAYDTGWHLIYALLADFQGVPSQQLLLYALIQSLAGGLLQLGGVAGRLADWSRKWSLVLADSITLPTILICALFPGEKVFFVSFLCMGLADAFFMPAIQAYVIDHVPRERVATELGKFWSSRGIAGLFPPILGGLLATAYGYSAPLLVNVGLGIVALAILVWKI